MASFQHILIFFFALICICIAHQKYSTIIRAENFHSDDEKTTVLERLSLPLRTSSMIARQFVKTIWNARDHLVAGATARGVSILCLYPLDTMKTRLQITGAAKAHLPPLSLSVLFKGVFGSLAGQIPYGMLTFGFYEVYKAQFLTQFPQFRVELIYFVSAILGDLTGSVWLCPSEVIKQQVQSGIHGSVGSAITAIHRKHGLKGFFKGYSGQLFRDVPFRAISLPTYELVKSYYTKRFATDVDGSVRTLSPVENLGIGIISGSFSAAVTTPLDVIKTRLMTGGGAIGSGSFSSVIETAVEIGRREGMRGLFSGLLPRVLYVGPSVGLFFVVYEGTKSYLSRRKQQQQREVEQEL